MNNRQFFKEYKEETDVLLDSVLYRIQKERKERSYVPTKEYSFWKIKNELRTILGERFEEVEFDLDFPPSHVSADLSFSVFDFIKKTKRNLDEVLSDIIEKINASKERFFIKHSFREGSFVNLELDSENLYHDILSSANSLGIRFGNTDINKEKTVLIDYSSPNIAKPIGVGHLRSTIIGQALANIYHATGFTEIKVNHIGDWGTQFGKLISAFRRWGDESKLEKNPLNELKELYVKFHQEAENNQDLEAEARDFFKRLEEGDPEMLALWKKFRDMSIRGFEDVYKKIGIHFDIYLGEAYFSEDVEGVVEECIKKGVAKIDAGSKTVVVDSIRSVPSFLLRKQDGSSLYITRDLAALKFRLERIRPDSILYVVGKEQELHFQQLFSLSKELGIFGAKKDIKHIWFGLVLKDGKKMATRSGRFIELESLIEESVSRAREIIKEKNPSVVGEELKDVSEAVGVGAIIYNDLRQSKERNISFDWKRMLDFEGGSAAYLQYACVRINSILKKIEKEEKIENDPKGDCRFVFDHELEFELAKKIMFFPSIVIRSQQDDSPHLIAGYIEELSRVFSNFYANVSVLSTEDKKLRYSRVILIKITKSVLESGMYLLNIRVPDRM